MKIIILLFFSLAIFLLMKSAFKNRAVTISGCNIGNYQDFIKKTGIHKCNLREANLQGADLRHTNLQEADLREANLQGADLRHTNLQEADLREANLEGIRWEGVDLSRVKVTREQEGYLRSQGRSGFIVLE